MEFELNFERFRKILMSQGEPDRVPLAELWVDQEIKESFMGKSMSGEILKQEDSYSIGEDIEFWAKAGYDYIHAVPQYKFPKKEEKATALKGVDDKEHRRVNWASEQTGLISNFAEFEKYPWEEAAKINCARLEEAPLYLPQGMKVISGSLAGVFEESWMVMGFETFVLSLYEQPELVKLVVDKVGEITLAVFEKVVNYPWVGALWLSDDIAYTEGTMISPEHLRRYIFPWYERITAVAKEHNLPILYHSDGKLWSVMADLIALGFNALHPIEPKAMNIKELKEKVGNKLCLLGGIDLDYPLTRGTPAEVREAVRFAVKEIAPGGGYAVGSSNSITRWVPLENYKAMIQATRDFGEYPLKL